MGRLDADCKHFSDELSCARANYTNMYSSFDNVRKRAARVLQNPRLLKVSFRSFRHWGGSMIAHYTNGNVLTVKKLLRHKRIENTMKYISMIHFEEDEFERARHGNYGGGGETGSFSWIQLRN